MDKLLEGLIILFTLCHIVLTLVCSHKGLLYDIAAKRENSKYNSNHSFTYKSKFYFSIPRFVSKNSKTTPTSKLARSYNLYVALFWLDAILLLIILFIFKL